MSEKSDDTVKNSNSSFGHSLSVLSIAAPPAGRSFLCARRRFAERAPDRQDRRSRERRGRHRPLGSALTLPQLLKVWLNQLAKKAQQIFVAHTLTDGEKAARGD